MATSMYWDSATNAFLVYLDTSRAAHQTLFLPRKSANVVLPAGGANSVLLNHFSWI